MIYRRSRGFTLLELVMAVSLSAIMGVGLVVAFNGGRRAEARATRESEARQVGRIALDWIVRDLESCWTTESELSHISGTDDEFNGLASDRITFATTAHLPPWRELSEDAYNAELEGMGSGFGAAAVPAPEADYVHVEYNIGLGQAEGEFGGLVRRVKTIPFTGSEEAEEGWIDQPIAREVVALNIQYYDGSEWADEWESSEREATEAYPKAFRVTLTVQVGNDDEARIDPATGAPERRTFVRTVALSTAPFIEPKPEEEEEEAAAAGGGGR
ncbi:MAG: prepilin-type N-terminal cleavage/methylation domain-containing protein [Planctomycetota bacterium]|jgi:general secretion pathway protein J